MKQLLFVLTAVLLTTTCCGQRTNYTTINGFTMGTTYHIIHDSPDTAAVSAGINRLLGVIDNSLSVYNPQSIISKVNRNETVVVDSFFTTVFLRSNEIYKATSGAFDISASPLFNVWGFGFKNKETVTPEQIDSLRQFVGMEHVRIENAHVVKDDPRVTLNANAVAKGYGVDVVAMFLAQSGAQNYIVEIGGEIRCQGENSKGRLWAVGIDKPIDGNLFPGQNLQTILYFTDKALATSGNYRKYYEEGGKKYAHTVNPATGYPVTHNLLSATVIADDCMTADAYATAFMVLGLEGAKNLLATHPELGAYLITDDHGTLQTFYTENMKALIKQ